MQLKTSMAEEAYEKVANNALNEFILKQRQR